MEKIFIYTDGGARGNPGPAAVGVVIRNEKGEIIKSISRKIGESTNNIAEYRAVIEALRWIKNSCQLFPRQSAGQAVVSCQFFLDSKLVVNQLNGYFKVKNSNLRKYLLEIRSLEQEIGKVITYQQIPRAKNKHADMLVNKALDA